MAYDYSKLNGKIVEICGTKQAFAKRIGLSERSVSLKLNNKVSWKQPEISAACEILGIPDKQIMTYFFTQEVQ